MKKSSSTDSRWKGTYNILSSYLCAIGVVYFFYLISPADVFLCSERIRVHPGLYNFHRHQRSNQLATKTKYICIVMLTCKRRTEWILTHAGIDSVYLVRKSWHCHTQRHPQKFRARIRPLLLKATPEG